eukprot:CAMPEP_0201886548 /NCGR_PEP_ID=MMETSP0902-20130614/22378_1 /ASSEMBLY_ACC=CAM_ASM_000551 /TAXON_ID=420261 /ORGANISM="Thalassiosira antarctica, Strain CCMP982" /LENGTH=80 /DNA_ID=CAMNT_0048416155 /DNA_START=638 /DNA_END=880 /DNA_ORIENTATION=-
MLLMNDDDNDPISICGSCWRLSVLLYLMHLRLKMMDVAEGQEELIRMIYHSICSDITAYGGREGTAVQDELDQLCWSTRD